MMNQCDGCKAGVETYERDGVTYHVMGPVIKLVGRSGMSYDWRDVMICEKDKYEEGKDGQVRVYDGKRWRWMDP